MIIALVGKNKPGEELKWSELSKEELASLASTPALFGGAQTFVLEGALYSDRAEEIVDLLEVFAESPHTFVLVEEKLLKAETEALKKMGAKIEIAKKNPPAGGKEFKFDQYGVATALGAGDKKKLWLGLMQSFKAGEKPEAVAGLMCWKARQIKNVKLSRELVRLYHDSHRGAGDLELLLERFALKL
jgi:hypothetical protein